MGTETSTYQSSRLLRRTSRKLQLRYNWSFIVTGSETRIHHYDSLSQQEAKSWKKPGEKTSTQPRQVTRSTAKIIITIFSDFGKVLFLSIFYHVLLQSMVHIKHHSCTGCVLLFERNLVVMSCFFTTRYLFTSPTLLRLLFSTQV